MWKNIVEQGSPQMTIWHMRIACWIRKATNAHSDYVIFIAFPLASIIARTLLSVMLYMHCLSRFRMAESFCNNSMALGSEKETWIWVKKETTQKVC